MLTTRQEYLEIAETTGLLKAMQSRFAQAGQEVELRVLRRIVARLRSNECRHMDRHEIIGWIESMTYPGAGRDDRQLDPFRV